MNKHSFPLLPLLFLLTPWSQQASAGSWYLQANETSTTYTSLSDWWDQPTGGGIHPSTLNGEEFFSNGFRVRTGNTAGTFGDSATVLHINSTLIVRSASAQTMTNLVSYGSSSNIAAGAGSVALTATNFNNAVATGLNGDGNSGRTLTLNFGTLSGAGNLSLTGTSTVNLTLSNASAFTGSMIWGDSSNSLLNFDSSFTSGGSLIAQGTARITLDQNVTFAGVTLNGDTLAAGTYSFATLNSTYDAIFTDGGFGSITVVPEPEISFLVLIGFAAIVARRWRGQRLPGR